MTAQELQDGRYTTAKRTHSLRSIFKRILGTPKKSYKQVPKCKHLSMPIPRRDLISTAYINIPTVVANRGCQNSCAYCSIHQLWGHQGLTRPFYDMWRRSYSLKRIMKRMSNTRYEKIIKLGANMGFKYYAHKLCKDGIINDFRRENY